MTTIAADRTSMAADSLMIDDKGLCDSTQKIWRADDALIGISGSVTDGLIFVDWYKWYRDREDEDKPKLGDDFEALVLMEDGLYSYHKSLVPVKINHQYWAIGSGAPIAIGAFAMDATPMEAVEAACIFDINTNGPILVERLKENEEG